MDESPRKRAEANGLAAAPSCGGRTRNGSPCQAPAMRNGRCRMHGGLSTGPRTPEGLERCRRAPWKHGRYSAEMRAFRRRITTLKRLGRLLAQMSDELERPSPDQRKLLVWHVESGLLEAELDRCLWHGVAQGEWGGDRKVSDPEPCSPAQTRAFQAGRSPSSSLA